MKQAQRATAIAFLKIAGEQWMARLPDREAHVGHGAKDMSSEAQSELELRVQRSRSATATQIMVSETAYAPVATQGRRAHDDPHEGFFFLVQIQCVLDVLDEPLPGQSPNGAFTRMFEHRYVFCRPSHVFRGTASHDELVRTLLAHLGGISEEDMTIVQAIIREWREQKADSRRADNMLAKRRSRERRRSKHESEISEHDTEIHKP